MSDKVFVDDNVLLVLSTSKVLTTFTTIRIKFESPHGIKGYWTANIHPTINTKLQAMVSFNIDGIWKVQAFITKANEKYHGMWADVKVYEALAPDTTPAPTTAPPP
jgi:hypothetical protein